MRSYSAAFQRTPMRPTVTGDVPGAGAPEMPRCEEFSSPSISETTRRNSSGVRAASACGS